MLPETSARNRNTRLGKATHLLGPLKLVAVTPGRTARQGVATDWYKVVFFGVRCQVREGKGRQASAVFMEKGGGGAISEPESTRPIRAANLTLAGLTTVPDFSKRLGRVRKKARARRARRGLGVLTSRLSALHKSALPRLFNSPLSP